MPAPQDQQIALPASLIIVQFGQDQLRPASFGSLRARRRQSIQLKRAPPRKRNNKAAERKSSTTFSFGRNGL